MGIGWEARVQMERESTGAYAQGRRGSLLQIAARIAIRRQRTPDFRKSPFRQHLFTIRSYNATDITRWRSSHGIG
jgi:uncharacterized membrane protein YgaE (UPF0421/DUF939 family)